MSRIPVVIFQFDFLFFSQHHTTPYLIDKENSETERDRKI